MKKILSFGILLGILVLNSGAGCGSKTEDPQPDNFQSLLGKWEAQSVTHTITKQNGTTVVDPVPFRARGVIIVWEFFKDGRLVATQDGKSREVRWKLTVTQLDGKDINDGKLTLIGTEEKELAQSIGQAGDLTYEIDISASAFAGKPTMMNLSVDVTSQGNYKKHILNYLYHKL